MADETEAEVLIRTGIATAPARMVGVHPYVIVPNDCRVESLEHMLSQPLRQESTVTLTDCASFNRYVAEFKGAGTRLYADVDRSQIVAVIDDHHGGEAQWKEHRATLSMPFDPDWLRWIGSNNHSMGQLQFAQFIEDQLPTIVEPDGAELLEVALHLETTQKMRFKSAQRLQDGSRQFVFEEQTEGKVGKGNLAIPEQFIVRASVYRWSASHDFIAKLRYRIKDGALSFSYHLHRPEDTVDEAFDAVCVEVEDFTKLAPLRGALQ